ncbi:MAG: 23S rRNA pseudouridine(2604) synthase RluF [Lachnospiraceae bacterium]|nr:23S rRNA pseudouridine(2604) synthase RluF [Lachnospiraceae bacterium]
MEVRINKYLSEAGVCSRRAADKYIEDGKVTIDGVVATMGSKVGDGQKVVFCGKELKKVEKLIMIVCNKPVGIVCTAAKDDKDNIVDFINYGERIYPIGRLDKDSQGLILLTNNGDMMNKILKAANNHEKEYIVTVNKPITDSFIEGMAGGVPILDRITNKCKVTKLNDKTFNIILTQGLNRQIRRMCEYFGYKVVKLNRIRIMNIKLGDLKLGEYREVTDTEMTELRNKLGM